MQLKTFISMGRLVVICLLCSVGGGLFVEASAQGHRIGVLTPGLIFDPLLVGLREGLEKLGYIEGKNVSYLIEDLKGDSANISGRARSLIDAHPDVIFSTVTTPSLAVKQATQTIPIVFAGVVDPVQSGLVANLISSGNNLTGVSANLVFQTAKRFEVLSSFVPQARRVLALVSTNDAVVGTTLKQLKHLEDAAAHMKIKIVRRDVANASELEKLYSRELGSGVDAIFHLPSVFIEKTFDRLIAHSHRERLPMIVHDNTLVTRGALVSFGGDFKLYGVQAARLVAKILKGGKPSDIPVETPDQLLTVVNRSTAKMLGSKVSKEAMMNADRIID